MNHILFRRFNIQIIVGLFLLVVSGGVAQAQLSPAQCRHSNLTCGSQEHCVELIDIPNIFMVTGGTSISACVPDYPNMDQYRVFSYGQDGVCSVDFTVLMDRARQNFVDSVAANRTCVLASCAFYPSQTSNPNQWSCLTQRQAPITIRAPLAPQNVSVVTNQVTQTRIVLSWSLVIQPITGPQGKIFYRIYRDGIFIGEKEITLVSGVNVGSYTDNNLTPDTRYTYQVSAVHKTATEEAEGGKSASVAGRTLPLVIDPGPIVPTPDAPQNLRLVSATKSSVVFSWQAVTPGQITYNIYRNGSLYRQNVVGTTFTNTGVVPDTGYAYKVSAVRTSGTVSKEGPKSSVLDVRTPPAQVNVWDAEAAECHVEVLYVLSHHISLPKTAANLAGGGYNQKIVDEYFTLSGMVRDICADKILSQKDRIIKSINQAITTFPPLMNVDQTKNNISCNVINRKYSASTRTVDLGTFRKSDFYKECILAGCDAIPVFNVERAFCLPPSPNGVCGYDSCQGQPVNCRPTQTRWTQSSCGQKRADLCNYGCTKFNDPNGRRNPNSSYIFPAFDRISSIVIDSYRRMSLFLRNYRRGYGNGLIPEDPFFR